MLPPLNDLIALLCIALVLSAGCLRLLSWRYGVTLWAKCITAAFFVMLWCPAGDAQLPLVAYVRGISSDLSISLVAIACLGIYQRVSDASLIDDRERHAANFAFAAFALFLYPSALGWGDWDAYRLGWGAPGMWVALLVVSLACWGRGFPTITIRSVAFRRRRSNVWPELTSSDPWQVAQ